MEKLIEILENVLGKGKSTARGNYAFHCPFCSSTKKKLEVQINSTVESENHWHCWSCNASGKKLTNLFKKLQVPREVIAELLSVIKVSGYYKQDSSTEPIFIKLPEEYQPLWRNNGSIEQKNALNYLVNERKVTLSEIIKYKMNVGWVEA